jgi:uncharacterized protein (TIGR03067 family)
MKARALMALAAGCLLLGTASLVADDDAKKALDALQGTWQLDSFSVDGMKAPADFVKEVKFTVKNNKYSLTIKGQEAESGTIKLDPSKKPKTIDLDIARGNDKGKKQAGIYTLEGDTLTFCLAKPGEADRPAKLESTKESKTVLSVMKRDKK